MKIPLLTLAIASLVHKGASFHTASLLPSRQVFSWELKSAGSPSVPLTSSVPQSKQKDSLEKFSQDVTRIIKEIRALPDPTDPEMFQERYPHLTMAYIWTDEDWKRQMSRRQRYVLGIIFMYRSRLMKRIVPQISVCVGWSVIASMLIHRSTLFQFFDFSMTSLSLVSTFVAALLTLRSNQGLTRLSDARSAWGRLVSASRDTAQVLSVYMYPRDPELCLLAARHLSIFCWLLKCRLREDDDSDIIDTMLPQEDAAYVKSERKHAAALVHRIRQIIAHMKETKKLPLSAHSRIESNLWYLNRYFGRCERVKGSCIPPLYTAHVTRLLVFYLFFLPFALAKKTAVVPTTFITGAVAFAMMGLDEIGHILEQPFRKMPLQEQATNAMRDVADAIVRQPPPLDDNSRSSHQHGHNDSNLSYNNLRPEY